MKNREGSILRRISGYLATFLVPAGLTLNLPLVSVPDTAITSVDTPIITKIEITEIADTFKPDNSTKQSAKPVEKPAAKPVEKPNNTISNNIKIGGRTISIFRTSATTTDSGKQVARYKEKFLYGHNTETVFGMLKNLPIGSTFSVTEDEIESNYQIASSITLEKSETARFMNALVDGRYKGNRYDLVLMTCAGESLGGGDATHRLIVFANRI